MPEKPCAWLIQVAVRRFADHVRAEAARHRREAMVVSLVPPEDQLALAADEEAATSRDDALDLLFMWCHPALSPPSRLYGLLLRMTDNPMVMLDHAIAKAMVHGPAAGNQRLDALAGDARLAKHHRLDAVRAHLLERAGDRPGAIALYRRVAERTASTPERNYLLTHAARLGEGG